ncbi:DUF2490 domain-containing protein [Persicobacter psychrovividus]|uniref:DUF2490 domain-containing protein n=1 Tax=Persicobacter psychrovividus TaxID=387638 RepID=A0ABN6LGX7_9BACT|nr:hypothetical protein PEPS_46810 [Persicobacter psychrovividus]
MKYYTKILIYSTLPFLCLFAQMPQHAVAQADEKRTDYQTWTDITLTYYHNDRLAYGGDIGIRGLISHQNWNSFYIRPTIHYKLSPYFKFSTGLGSFNTMDNSLSNTYEVRLFQDIRVYWPNISGINVSHRFRFEERYFMYDDLDNEQSFRARYMLNLRTNNFRFIGPKKGYHVGVMWEAFVPIGKSAPELFINNQRWYAVFGYRSSDAWRFELHYIWQQSRLFEDDGFVSNESVLRFRILYSIQSKKFKGK